MEDYQVQEVEWDEEQPVKKKRRFSIAMTNTALKIYGCVTMLFYLVAMSVIQNGMIHVNDYTAEELSNLLAENPDVMFLSGWASVFQLIGGLAVPVFAFLLVEGFQHTRSFRTYLITMLIFAVVSEVPYDLAMNNVLLDWSSQNLLVTLSICLVMLYGLRLFDQGKGILRWVIQILIVLAAIFWCSLVRGAFGLCMVLLVAGYYLLREHKGGRLLYGIVVSLMYVTGPLSIYALYSYNGDRGWNKNKYIFYALYPITLLACGLIARAMMG